MADIAAFALEHSVEVPFVRETIRACRLEPPADAPEAWPWPVRLCLLGHFELWPNGERVAFSGKVQRKPLELLRAVALLGGADVRESAVIDALWPDADGDRAAHSLETAAYRLRKLLDCPAALRQQAERLSLDPQYCWIDAISLLHRVNRALDSVARDDTDTVEQALYRILSLYRGRLIAFDEDQGEADLSSRLRQKLEAGLGRLLLLATRRLGEARPSVAQDLAERARALGLALGP